MSKIMLDEVSGLIRDLLEKLAGSNGRKWLADLKKFLRGELAISELPRKWREENDVIYFSVTSDGTLGEEWIKRLEGNGCRVGDYAKQVLRSPDFKPTNGVTTEVAVLKGMLFEDNDRVTKKIRAEGALRKLVVPNAELACLIRLKFMDKEIEAMGLWYIVAMHEPVNDSDGDPHLLYADRSVGGRGLFAYDGGSGYWWSRGSGFAFAVSQASSCLSTPDLIRSHALHVDP